jgi:hypothetical protein
MKTKTERGRETKVNILDGLHDVLTCHGIASRSGFQGLIRLRKAEPLIWRSQIRLRRTNYSGSAGA